MIRPRLAFAVLALSILATVAVVPVHSQTLSQMSQSFEDVTAKISPAVVQIFTTGFGPSHDRSSIFTKRRGTGSGIILDPKGYIITNAHVVAGARLVRVMIPLTAEERTAQKSALKTEGRVVGGQVIGVDYETDLAVVKVNAGELPFLKLADSDQVQQGQVALAFGNPFGLNASVSMGVVSAVARQLAPEHPVVYIQTDATINPGNSGGPLVNGDGDVVGINTMIFSQSGGSEGIGFAVPSNIVSSIFEQIRATGKVRRGQIGVYAQTADPILSRGLLLDDDQRVVLGDVYPNSPAEKAGLRVGHVILSLDGKKMENGRQFHVNLYRKVIGNEVSVEYVRAGKKSVAKVAVVERPSRMEHFADIVTPEQNLIDRLGILVLTLTPQLNMIIPGLRKQEGVVVAAQSADSPVWRDRFVPGDVIYEVNGGRIRNKEDLKAVVASMGSGDPLVLLIQRGAHTQYLWFQMDY
jgi:serine protease Do